MSETSATVPPYAANDVPPLQVLILKAGTGLDPGIPVFSLRHHPLFNAIKKLHRDVVPAERVFNLERAAWNSKTARQFNSESIWQRLSAK
jgi:hypothetical protein